MFNVERRRAMTLLARCKPPFVEMRQFAPMLAALIAMTAPSTTFGQDSLTVLPLVSERQLVLTPDTLGILVNSNDPGSVQLGNRYAAIRGIPLSNIVALKLPRTNYVVGHIMERELQNLRNLPDYPKFVAFALAFDQPYRVGANQSITAAISQGVTRMAWKGECNLTEKNVDFGAKAGAELLAKPAMMLSGNNGLSESIALAQRGKASDATDPPGDIFLVKTPDKARSAPRETAMDRAAQRFAREVTVSVLQASSFKNHTDVFGLQIGLPVLEDLQTLHFRPGAYADHLTSFGGAIGETTSQTRISALIQAGATASFGTVREPCNFQAKFPDPELMLANYLRGDSVIEAYWKSVAMTTEGLLVGEPLARPFPLLDVERNGSDITVRMNRHTDGYLADFARGSGSDAGAPVGKLDLFAIEKGFPRLIRHLLLPADAKPGAVIDSFKPDVVDTTTLVLGVIPRR